MPNQRKCAGCLKNIPDRQFLKCCHCKNDYDLDCANVSIQRFYNTMQKEHKDSWECKSCRYKQQKLATLKKTASTVQQKTRNSDGSNITIRKKRNTTNSSSEEDLSIMGDTIQLENTLDTDPLSQNTPNHTEMFQKILESLETNKQAIINEIKTSMELVIKTAISELKAELTQKIAKLDNKQDTIRKDLSDTEKKVKDLTTENEKLKEEIQDLKEKFASFNQSNKENSTKVQFDNSKTIVLYGLRGHKWETEDELYEQVLHIFYDVLNLNLEGNIDDLKRLGRGGRQGPIQIELLSKQMVKYIINNRHYFRNTGLTVSEFLDESSRNERKALITTLIEARKAGHRANIINNKLIINGTEHKEAEESTVLLNGSNINQHSMPIISQEITTEGKKVNATYNIMTPKGPTQINNQNTQKIYQQTSNRKNFRD